MDIVIWTQEDVGSSCLRQTSPIVSFHLDQFIFAALQQILFIILAAFLGTLSLAIACEVACLIFHEGQQILDLKQILYIGLGSTSTNMDPAVGEVGFRIFA